MLIASSPDYERDILKQLLGLGLSADVLVCGSFLRGTSAATRLAGLRTMPEPARCAASGISYFACGFHAPSWPEPACNLAWNSQDRYYDLCMAKAALAAPAAASVGTWILGLSHYSLHYDMTLSRTWRRAFHYADLFGFHNLSAERRADPVYAPQAAVTASFPFDDVFRARLLTTETALQFAAAPRMARTFGQVVPVCTREDKLFRMVNDRDELSGCRFSDRGRWWLEEVFWSGACAPPKTVQGARTSETSSAGAGQLHGLVRAVGVFGGNLLWRPCFCQHSRSRWNGQSGQSGQRGRRDRSSSPGLDRLGRRNEGRILFGEESHGTPEGRSFLQICKRSPSAAFNTTLSFDNRAGMD